MVALHFDTVFTQHCCVKNGQKERKVMKLSRKIGIIPFKQADLSHIYGAKIVR
jgi:hypothetical protein